MCMHDAIMGAFKIRLGYHSIFFMLFRFFALKNCKVDDMPCCWPVVNETINKAVQSINIIQAANKKIGSTI
ncbi:hypothetical protein AZH11_01970 [Pseudomonas simiae]|nr:hypothetical protein AZH11_01970 [Pseudomonas simiae]